MNITSTTGFEHLLDRITNGGIQDPKSNEN
jgi:hypothetical protein